MTAIVTELEKAPSPATAWHGTCPSCGRVGKYNRRGKHFCIVCPEEPHLVWTLADLEKVAEITEQDADITDEDGAIIEEIPAAVDSPNPEGGALHPDAANPNREHFGPDGHTVDHSAGINIHKET